MAQQAIAVGVTRHRASREVVHDSLWLRPTGECVKDIIRLLQRWMLKVVSRANATIRAKQSFHGGS